MSVAGSRICSMTTEPPGLPHPLIFGEPGELIELLVQLIDREPVEYPAWWFDYGAIVGIQVDVGFTPDVRRRLAMQALRASLERIVDAGLDEAFLVRSLMADLEDFVNRLGNTAGYDTHIDQLRSSLLEVIEDADARARWRQAMAIRKSEWLTRSDDEVIEAARAGYESFATKYATADDAASRWAHASAWREAASELLPPEIYDHWSHLSLMRALRQQRGE